MPHCVQIDVIVVYEQRVRHEFLQGLGVQVKGGGWERLCDWDQRVAGGNCLHEILSLLHGWLLESNKADYSHKRKNAHESSCSLAFSKNLDA